MKGKVIILFSIMIVLLGACVYFFYISDKREFKDYIEIELGENIPESKDYFENKKYNNESVIYKFNGENVEPNTSEVKSYLVYIKDKKVSELRVIDSTGPVLELKELTVNHGDPYDINDFIVSCTDNSGSNCIYKYLSDASKNLSNVGEYAIYIEAKDKFSNKTTNKTILKIVDSKSGNKNEVVTTTKYIYSTTTKKNSLPSTTSIVSTATSTVPSNNILDEAIKVASSNKSIYNEVLKYTNEYRSEKNLPLLSIDKDLEIAANIRAIEMAKTDTFSHTRPNGKSCYSVLDDLKVTKFRTNAENIASLSRSQEFSARSVATVWRNSQSHYSNMVDPDFKYIGIGYYVVNNNHYYVQVFGG